MTLILLPSAAMRGVSVYQRAGRHTYYLSYTCPIKDQRVHVSTPFRVDDPEGLRKAHNLALEKAKEIRFEKLGTRAERWEVWVLPFLEHQYRNSLLTLKRYKSAWKWLSLFFIEEKRVFVPRAVTYQHGREFHQWRTSFAKASGRTASSNTALDDMKVMQVVLNEAVNRGFATENPWARLHIKRDKVRHARELEPHELAKIEASLPAFVAEKPEQRGWMPVAFQIARYQGCRLRETRINLRRDVNLRDDRLTLHVKGHKAGEGHTTLLHPKLRPLFEELIASGKQWSLDYGPVPSVHWRKFFDSIGLRDAWFHCLRSTVITEMARAGVPISIAMRYVLHASEEIHRIYQRLKTGDLTHAAAAVGSRPEQSNAAREPSAEFQAALVAELVKAGVPLVEAMRQVLHAGKTMTTAGDDLTRAAAAIGGMPAPSSA